MESIKVGIFGATGYTGLELVRLLGAHPNAQIVFSTSESMAGKSLKESWPQAPDIPLQSASSVNYGDVDCVFLCLPHTQSALVAAQALAQGVRAIDLSADLRINDPAVYAEWYKVAHPHPELLPVPYGLPELGREKLHGAQAIANPGCYATATLLALEPLARQELILEGTPVIVDAKSGVSGAGRKPKANTLFGEVHGNFSPYNIGRGHRHIGEIEQVLADSGFEAGRLVFSPHLLPTDRGILAASYVQVNDAQAAADALAGSYQDEPLVQVLPAGQLATLAHVVRTPLAAISATPVSENLMIVNVAIDNLLKGASSQAVQNFNLMWSIPETTGLLFDSEVTYA